MWEQVRLNRRRSVLVVSLMGVILVGVGAALGWTYGGSREAALLGGAAAFALWLIQWLVMQAQGDDILLRMASAREIAKGDHPQLVNIVEEMTIAAQLSKAPRVFIVDDPAPNAFAVGRDPEKAAVAVTIGLLELLDRDELQGVVAHEIGHIKNRDVALMTTAGIMAGAIVLLVEVGLRVMWLGGGRRGSRDSEGGGAQGVLMLVALLFLVLAPVLAQLIYMALSRRREYLADASGALFTRWPEGLASALEKLGSAAEPQTDQSRVTAPMYIVRPLKKGGRRSLSLFSTHPPLEERVTILRSMGGGADPAAYDLAYSGVTSGGHVVGARTLGVTESLPARRPEAPAEASSARSRLRQGSDAYLAGAGYSRHECTGCGATLKIPASLRTEVAACPRCQTPVSSG